MAPKHIKLTYCRNWDGGAQERDVLSKTIKEIFPDVELEVVRLDDYPVMVHIYADGVEVYKGSQKDFFRKNGHRGLPNVKQALQKLA